MRRLISARPLLAVARYHVLAGLRTAHGSFVLTFIAAGLPTVLSAPIFESESNVLRWDPTMGLMDGGVRVSAVLILHLILLIAAAGMVNAPRARTDGREVADLFETAPITSGARFFGDMLGALVCLLVIHLCTLPLIAFAFLFSAVAVSVFWSYELLVLAVLIFAAAASAWKRRTPGPAGRAKAAGVVALFMTLVIIAFATTTRWTSFRDALAGYIAEPSPLRWSQLMLEVVNPSLLMVLLIAIWTGFVAYFAIRSTRLIERRQEVMG